MSVSRRAGLMPLGVTFESHNLNERQRPSLSLQLALSRLTLGQGEQRALIFLVLRRRHEFEKAFVNVLFRGALSDLLRYTKDEALREKKNV